MRLLDDSDDLIGDIPDRVAPGRAEKLSTRTVDVHRVVGGVSVPWLVKAFRMSRSKIEKALRDCRPIGTHANGGLYYDLPEAASFLVTPKKDLRDMLKSITAKDLPDELREGYWSAKLKEQKFRVLAGELWPTPAVLEVLGETFKTIKNTIQLWSETVDESVGLTDEQRDLVVKLCDRLQDDLYKALVLQAKSNATESQLAELDGETQAT